MSVLHLIVKPELRCISLLLQGSTRSIQAERSGLEEQLAAAQVRLSRFKQVFGFLTVTS